MHHSRGPQKSPADYGPLVFVIFLLAVVFASFHAKAEEKWTLTEQSLLTEVRTLSPDHLRQQVQRDLREAEKLEHEDQYGFKSVSSITLQDSTEKGIASFIPTFGPTSYFATGVQKKTRQGATFDMSLFVDQQSAISSGIDEATRTGVVFNASADLWKNLFGRLDKADEKSKKLSFERQKLESEINQRAVELDLRKTYWALVANSEKLKAAQVLLKISEQQLKEGLRRQGQFIADKGEIAKYRSQVETRKANINSYEYEKDLLMRSLKMALPNVAAKKMVLGEYDTGKAVQEVLFCSARLQQMKKTPWQNTKWDEVIELIEKNYEQKKIKTARNSDLDLQLEAQLQYSGVDQGYSNSIDDLGRDGKMGGSIGLALTIPLGDAGDRAQKAREAADYNAFVADKVQYRATIESQHSQIVSLVRRLNAAIQNLHANDANLEESLEESKKKFKQARISLNDLIADQNALFTNKISEIDTKLEVVNTLLDYFKVFTEDQCSFNKLDAQVGA